MWTQSVRTTTLQSRTSSLLEPISEHSSLWLDRCGSLTRSQDMAFWRHKLSVALCTVASWQGSMRAIAPYILICRKIFYFCEKSYSCPNILFQFRAKNSPILGELRAKLKIKFYIMGGKFGLISRIPGLHYVRLFPVSVFFLVFQLALFPSV